MDIERILKDANPVPLLESLDTGDQELMLRRIRARISAQNQDDEIASTRRQMLRPRIAVAALMVIIITAMITVNLFEGSTVPVANAANLLNRAAMNTIVKTPQSHMTSQPYLSIHRTGYVAHATGPTGWLVSVDRTDYVPMGDDARVWVSERKADKVVQIFGHGDINRPQPTHAIWATAPVNPEMTGWANPSQAFLRTLPMDPSQLRNKIYGELSSNGNSPDGSAFVAITDLLKSGRAGDDLRAALYRVLALIPEVRASQPIDPDLSGGTAFTIDMPGDLRQVVISPETGDLLAVRTVTSRLRDGIPAGTVTEDLRVSSSPVPDVPAHIRSAVTGPCKPGPFPNGCFQE